MKKLNILDLHKTINQKNHNQIKTYEKILERCYSRIQTSSNKKHLKCFFEVPDYMIGYPIYDLNNSITYIIDNLKSSGFIATYYFPRFIYISWDLEEIEEFKKQKINNIKQQNSNLLDFKYKPSGKLSLNI